MGVYFSVGRNLKWSKSPNAGGCLAGGVNERRAPHGSSHSFVKVIQIFNIPDNILKTASYCIPEIH